MSQVKIDFERSIRNGVRELKASEEELKSYFSSQLESCSLFLMPVNQSDPGSVSSCEALVKELASTISLRTGITDFPGIMSGAGDPDSYQLYSLIFEDIDPAYLKQLLLAKLQEISGINHRSIRYNRYGLFIPRTGKVICFSFAHSGSMYYRYRLAEFKINNVPPGLRNYLLSLLTFCPNEYFYSGSRASGFFLDMKSHLEHPEDHEISSFAASALKVGKFKSGHENVEKFLLESDPKTIACEVPVWYENPQNSRLKIEGILTGHIDVLRYENDGRIGVWDYKPRARYEKKANVQVYLYALMLSQRTGIPLSNFLCGYFDKTDAYSFNAADVSF